MESGAEVGNVIFVSIEISDAAMADAQDRRSHRDLKPWRPGRFSHFTTTGGPNFLARNRRPVQTCPILSTRSSEEDERR